MSCPDYLYNELFPIQIHHNDYYIPNKLTANEKFYLALYENAKGNIHKVDLVMSDMVSNKSIGNIKKHLSELGLITIMTKITPEDVKEFTIKNSNKGLICQWCGKQSFILHKHHYPILASNGGKDIVNICPNCHYTYHKVMGEME